jgi:hypothetical protein
VISPAALGRKQFPKNKNRSTVHSLSGSERRLTRQLLVNYECASPLTQFWPRRQQHAFAEAKYITAKYAYDTLSSIP